eukprot:4229445-Prorocentrum_lima.AAC.1
MGDADRSACRGGGSEVLRTCAEARESQAVDCCSNVRPRMQPIRSASSAAVDCCSIGRGAMRSRVEN